MGWLILFIAIFAVLPLLAGQHMRDKYESKWKPGKGKPGLPAWEKGDTP